MSGNSQFGILIDLSDRLSRLLARESEHLRAMRLNNLAALQDEKAKLTAAYSGAFESVRANPSAVKSAETGMRKALKDATSVLKEKVADNMSALSAAKMLNERLIRALSEAVATTLMPIAAYTATGGTAPTSSATGWVPLAIDNRI